MNESFNKSQLDHFDELFTGNPVGVERNLIALRGLNKLDQALDIQNDLLKEYEKISDQRLLPMELIYVGRGLVYEELAEIYFARESDEQSQKYARLSYEDLSKDAWMKKLYPKRIERMLELGKL